MEEVINDSVWESFSVALPSGTAVGHWAALDIWINKPHVLNRNLCGSCLLLRGQMKSALPLEEAIKYIKSNSLKFSDTERLEQTLQSVLINEDDMCGEPLMVSLEICIRDIHPKQLDRYTPLREAIVIGTFLIS